MMCDWQLDGDIGDCTCSIESVDFFNNEQVFPIVDELMLRNYFRYYKVLLVVSLCHVSDCYIHTEWTPSPTPLDPPRSL